MGTTAGVVTINGDTTITNTLDANTLQGTAVSSPISLYTNSTSGNIDIGNSLNTITINGATRFFQTVTASNIIVDTIQGTSVASSINLYANITTGVINFLTAITTGAISIGSALQTGIMTIYGSTTNTSNLFTNTTSGGINIGNANQTGYTNIYGAKTTGNTNALFTNVTSGAIDIGTNMTTGVLKIGSSVSTATTTQIYGTTTGDNQLFKNVTTGDINIGGVNQTGEIYIGGVNQTGNTNIGGISQTGTINIGNGNLTSNILGGSFTRTLCLAPEVIYHFDKTTYLTGTTTLSSPFSRYYICNFTSSGNINLPAPAYQFEGLEIIIRYVNAVVTPTTAAGTNVFINLSNNVTSTLIATVSYRIICGLKAGSYYWIQLY
jgi:hypothetical protein